MPADTVQGLAVAWLERRDVRTLQDANHLAWLLEQLRLVGRNELAPKEFSVQWTGAIQAPADGSYTFSLSPFDMNCRFGKWFRRQTVSVWIGGRQVLDSTANGWTHTGQPVTLRGGAKTPIRVELSYACSDGISFTDRPAIALLFWEGAGTSTPSFSTDFTSVDSRLNSYSPRAPAPFRSPPTSRRWNRD
ncbi:MAG: hypothetical protein FJ276_15790 [Planctomycetes bacterium]|nr:hypothetical protein [Planctomycetota bacterium]